MESESFTRSLGWLVGPSVTFNPSEGIVNSLLNSGKIDIISNDSLKTLLIKWKDLVFDYQEEELELDEMRDRLI